MSALTVHQERFRKDMERNFSKEARERQNKEPARPLSTSLLMDLTYDKRKEQVQEDRELDRQQYELQRQWNSSKRVSEKVQTSYDTKFDKNGKPIWSPETPMPTIQEQVHSDFSNYVAPFTLKPDISQVPTFEQNPRVSAFEN